MIDHWSYSSPDTISSVRDNFTIGTNNHLPPMIARCCEHITRFPASRLLFILITIALGIVVVITKEDNFVGIASPQMVCDSWAEAFLFSRMSHHHQLLSLGIGTFNRKCVPKMMGDSRRLLISTVSQKFVHE